MLFFFSFSLRCFEDGVDEFIESHETQLEKDLIRENFERNKKRKFRVDAIYSSEHMLYPQSDGSVCANKKDLQEGTKLDCASGFGSACMVTGSFGFLAASQAIKRYLQDQQKN